MSNTCTNCYNGCAEITSDKCVKYTGVDIPELGISNGDTLLHVEQQIISYLSTTLDGTGIFPIVASSDICSAAQSNLPLVGPLTLNNYLTGLFKTLCQIDDAVTALENENPNTLYDVDCLTPTSNTDTHEVLQSVIYKVCTLAQQLSDFVTYVDATYVKISDINTYIQNYLDTQPSETLISNRMVPNAVVPYIGTLSNFDITGAGLGDWDRIFLCNGNNGTPDLRGRALIGATTGMGGGPLDAAVDPAVSGNPNYAIGSTHGTNSVVLSQGQIPSHTHTATVSSVADHTHDFPNDLVGRGTGGPDAITNQNNIPSQDYTQTDAAGGHTHTVTIGNTGGGLGHPNYQPGRGIYYIVYLP